MEKPNPTLKIKWVSAILQKTDMAASSALHGSISKCTARSISLPTRLHPSSLTIEAELKKQLKAWELASSASVAAPPGAGAGAETVRAGLAGAMHLYKCLQEFILSPLIITHHGNEELVEQALDRSVTLLDACATARDIILTTRESLQKLQSALRRKGGAGDSTLDADLASYISSRKAAMKGIAKSLGGLQKMESSRLRSSSPVLQYADQRLTVLVREVSGAAVSNFRSLLLFFSPPEGRKLFGGLSLITKMMMPMMSSGRGGKRVANTEVGSVDVAVHALRERLQGGGDAIVELRDLQRMLGRVDASIEGLEGGVDCMYRCLIQNRVSLLNLLTP